MATLSVTQDRVRANDNASLQAWLQEVRRASAHSFDAAERSTESSLRAH